MGAIVVRVSTISGYSKSLELTGDNFGLFQKLTIPTGSGIPDTVSVVAEGTGGKCLVSTTVSWFEAEVTIIEPPPIIITTEQFVGEFRRRRGAVEAPNPVYTTKVCATIAEG